MDDKTLVILSVTVIALAAMVAMPSENIITAIVSGLFGVAVGRAAK
jgi:hypothetical protein